MVYFYIFSVKEMVDLLWEQSVDVGLMNHCVISINKFCLKSDVRFNSIF